MRSGNTKYLLYVLKTGLLMAFFLIIFGAYILLSDKKEFFAQCVYLPKGRQINSLNVDIDISKTKSSYEIKLSEFQKVLNTNNITSRKDVLSEINNVRDLFAIKEDKFELIYEIKNEILIYRSPSAYGFHLKFSKNPQKIKVVGIVNQYDILAQYIQNIPKEYHTIEKIHYGTEADNISVDDRMKKFIELQKMFNV